jgi:hypothetical protein
MGAASLSDLILDKTHRLGCLSLGALLPVWHVLKLVDAHHPMMSCEHLRKDNRVRDLRIG